LGDPGVALLGTIKFLCDELLVPAQDRVGLDHMCYFLQRLLAQLLADLSQGLALAITQAYTTFNLAVENTVFAHQILIAQQQFLINGPSDICQKLFPIHRRPPQALPSIVMLSMGERAAEDKLKRV